MLKYTGKSRIVGTMISTLHPYTCFSQLLCTYCYWYWLPWYCYWKADILLIQSMLVLSFKRDSTLNSTVIGQHFVFHFLHYPVPHSLWIANTVYVSVECSVFRKTFKVQISNSIALGYNSLQWRYKKYGIASR